MTCEQQPPNTKQQVARLKSHLADIQAAVSAWHGLTMSEA